MKNYYYLTGKTQNGPFTLEEIKAKHLKSETLVWSDGLENWKKLKDFPELFESLNIEKVPPPPPNNNSENVTTQKKTGRLHFTTKKSLALLIIWIAFHLFALLMSYSQVEIFNDAGKPETNKFWPFSPIIKTFDNRFYHPISLIDLITNINDGNEIYFDGIFVDYDKTEFIFYVGIAILIYFLFRISKKHSIDKVRHL